MVRSIDRGYGAGTHMAARFVLDKVDCETVRLCAFGAYENSMCTRANVQHVGYQEIAAVAKLRRNVKGVLQAEF